MGAKICPAYPVVKYFAEDGLQEGGANVYYGYYGYTYTGNIEDFLRQIERRPSQIIQMTDLFFS